jgi:hypothetical protein
MERTGGLSGISVHGRAPDFKHRGLEHTGVRGPRVPGLVFAPGHCRRHAGRYPQFFHRRFFHRHGQLCRDVRGAIFRRRSASPYWSGRVAGRLCGHTWRSFFGPLNSSGRTVFQSGWSRARGSARRNRVFPDALPGRISHCCSLGPGRVFFRSRPPLADHVDSCFGNRRQHTFKLSSHFRKSRAPGHGYCRRGSGHGLIGVFCFSDVFNAVSFPSSSAGFQHSIQLAAGGVAVQKADAFRPAYRRSVLSGHDQLHHFRPVGGTAGNHSPGPPRISLSI